MKQINGAWLPDDEQDKVMLSAGSRYQGSKFRAAMDFVKQRSVAVDVGGHCGLWSMQMLKLFPEVIAFEPLPRHIECFKVNAPDATLHEVALGNRDGTCGIELVVTLSGRSHVKESGDIPMRTLDSYELRAVDLLKIDVEGYEKRVLEGGVETILRCQPVIVVEQKSGTARYGFGEREAVTFLEGLGMKLQREMIGDFIMSFP